MTINANREPAWLAEVKPDSHLNRRDLAKMFGYKAPHCIGPAVARGLLPKPDITLAGGKVHWFVKTIRREFKRRRAAIQNKEES